MLAHRETSKILLVVWLVLGGALLLVQDLTTNRLILYAVGLIAVIWNRMDSRNKSYKIALSGPGGMGVNVQTGEEDPPS